MSNDIQEKKLRARSVTTIIAAVILAGGLGYGMSLVGNGLSAKAGNSITVTGSAKTSATADNVVWTLNVQESGGIGSLLQSGVNVNNYGPQYYVSNLADLRPQLLADAMKDAKVRGEAITKAVGSTLGPVLAVSSGPVQVTSPDSVDTSAGGMYDTSSIPKTVTVTVSVGFKVSK